PASRIGERDSTANRALPFRARFGPAHGERTAAVRRPPRALPCRSTSARSPESPMHVVFVEPAFPRNQREFVRALHAVGARVTGIGERAIEALDDELKGWLYKYERISSVTNEEALLAAVRRAQSRDWVDRLEATVAAH